MLAFKLCMSDIIPPSRFLLLEELVGSSFFLILSFLFYFLQFFSNFLKYSSSNFLSSHLYNIFTIYFPSSSSLLNFLSFDLSNFFYLLTFVFILSLNSATNSFVFFKSFFFSQLSCSTINLFHHTKYFTTSLTFLLFKIFSTSYSSTSFISISLASSFLCFPTWSLYSTIQLMFTTEWILIEVSSCNLTTLVETTSLMIYGLIY